MVASPRIRSDVFDCIFDYHQRLIRSSPPDFFLWVTPLVLTSCTVLPQADFNGIAVLTPLFYVTSYGRLPFLLISWLCLPSQRERLTPGGGGQYFWSDFSGKNM